MLTFINLIILIVGCIGLAIALSAICNAYETHRDEKRKKAHPDLFKWLAEVDAKGLEAIHYKAKKITPHKTRIDYILANLQYDPAEIVEERQSELEGLRMAIYEAQPEWKRLNAEVEELRTKISQYVKDNNLKWAEDWGG